MRVRKLRRRDDVAPVSGEHDYLKGWWHGGDADRAHWRLERSNGATSGPAYAVAIDADGG